MPVDKLATSLYNARNGNLNSEETKKRVGEAAVGTSAAAAAGRKAGFSMFKTSSKVGNLSGEVVDSIRIANKPVKETKVLFGSFGKVMRKYSEAFSDWVQKAPVLGKLVKTSVFRGTAKCFGFGLAVLTLVTGLTNIATTTTNAYENHVKKSKFIQSLNEEENTDESKEK